MQEIISAFRYVIDGNMFWQSMGMTTATAIFIGAILFHEVNKNSFIRAFATVLIYSIFLIYTSVARVSPNIANGIISYKTHAASITIVLVTVAYLMGLVIGYYILRRRNDLK